MGRGGLSNVASEPVVEREVVAWKDDCVHGGSCIIGTSPEEMPIVGAEIGALESYNVDAELPGPTMMVAPGEVAWSDDCVHEGSCVIGTSPDEKPIVGAGAKVGTESLAEVAWSDD